MDFPFLHFCNKWGICNGRWRSMMSDMLRHHSFSKGCETVNNLRKARKWGKENGYDIDDFLLAVIGGDKKLLGVKDVPLRDRILCAKLFKEYTMSKTSEQNINVNQQLGPRIGLPPTRQDPALKIVNRKD